MLDALQKLDTDFFIYLNNLGVEQYDEFWKWITRIYVWIPFFLAVLYLITRNFSKEISLKVIGYLVGLIITVISFTEMVRNLVGRLRPNNNTELGELIRILHQPDSYSFFSGHASNSFALTTFVVLVLRKKQSWIWLLYIWPVLFSFSRIYVGVHYPSDILIGIIVGVLFACFFFRLFNKKVLHNPAHS